MIINPDTVRGGAKVVEKRRFENPRAFDTGEGHSCCGDDGCWGV